MGINFVIQNILTIFAFVYMYIYLYVYKSIKEHYNTYII